MRILRHPIFTAALLVVGFGTAYPLACGGQSYNYLERVPVRAIVFVDGGRLTF